MSVASVHSNTVGHSVSIENIFRLSFNLATFGLRVATLMVCEFYDKVIDNVVKFLLSATQKLWNTYFYHRKPKPMCFSMTVPNLCFLVLSPFSGLMCV